MTVRRSTSWILCQSRRRSSSGRLYFRSVHQWKSSFSASLISLISSLSAKISFRFSCICCFVRLKGLAADADRLRSNYSKMKGQVIFIFEVSCKQVFYAKLARYINAERREVREVLYKIDGFRTRTNKDAHKYYGSVRVLCAVRGQF